MSWSRLKQKTRETFTISDDQKTDIPADVTHLLNRADAASKLMNIAIDQSLMFFPEPKVKTKNADDPSKGQPIYMVGDALAKMSAEYHDKFFQDASVAIKKLGSLKAELDADVQRAFIEPKRDLLNGRIAESFAHRERLKKKRLELDTQKYKLKQEVKNGDEQKIKRYESEVAISLDRFDAEADAIRELLQPLQDDEQEMIRQQSMQTAAMMALMKEYFLKSLQTLEEFEVLNQPQRFSAASSASGTPAKSLSSSSVNVKPIYNGTPKSSAMNRSFSSLIAPAQHVPAAAFKLPAVMPKPKFSKKCCALYDFPAEQPDDLTMIKGDLIEILKENGEWWSGRNIRTGQTGNFPSNYCQLID